MKRWIAALAALAVLACNSQPAASPQPAAAVPAMALPVPAVPAAGSFGVPECDHYLARACACNAQLCPGTQQAYESWRASVTASPASRAGIAQTCVQLSTALDASCPGGAAAAPHPPPGPVAIAPTPAAPAAAPPPAADPPPPAPAATTNPMLTPSNPRFTVMNVCMCCHLGRRMHCRGLGDATREELCAICERQRSCHRCMTEDEMPESCDTSACPNRAPAM